MVTDLDKRLHNVDGNWNDLGGSELDLDQIFNQLILLYGERHNRLSDLKEKKIILDKMECYVTHL